MRMRVTIGNAMAMATLDDNPTARDFASLQAMAPAVTLSEMYEGMNYPASHQTNLCRGTMALRTG